MKIFLIKRGEALFAADQESLDFIHKLSKNEVYSINIKKERSYEFHKKFFALCKLGCENSKNVEMPLDPYRRYALIKSGYFKIYSTPKGSYVEADSISFEKMSQDEFEKVYSDVLNFIIKDTEATKEDIINNLINFM